MAGGFTKVSDDLSLYGHDEWNVLTAVLSVGRSGDEPLDLHDPFASTLTVRSSTSELIVDDVYWQGEVVTCS